MSCIFRLNATDENTIQDEISGNKYEISSEIKPFKLKDGIGINYDYGGHVDITTPPPNWIDTEQYAIVKTVYSRDPCIRNLKLNKDFSSTDDFTFAFWMYITEYQTWPSIFNIGGGYFHCERILVINNNAIVSSTENRLQLPGKDYRTWTHIAIVRYNNNLSWYKNGICAGYTVSNNMEFDFSNRELRFFSYDGGITGTYSGAFLDFSVWDEALFKEDFTPPKRLLGNLYYSMYNNDDDMYGIPNQ